MPQKILKLQPWIHFQKQNMEIFGISETVRETHHGGQKLRI